MPVVFAILGLISTGIFNLTLGRRGFEAEPLSATLVWGARSVVGPFVLVVLLTAAVWMAALVFRLINTVPPVAGAMSRLARWPPYVSIRNLVLDPVRFAQTVSAGGAVAIIAICWRFRSVLEAFSDFADTMPASELAALADGQRQLSFRYYASLLIVVLGFCLVHILRLRARQPAVHGRSTLYSCMVVLAIAVVLNDAPYRLIHDATGERAVLNGMRCYVIGESAARVLLFCPELPAPRNRVVAQNDPALQRLGFRENIFAVAR